MESRKNGGSIDPFTVSSRTLTHPLSTAKGRMLVQIQCRRERCRTGSRITDEMWRASQHLQQRLERRNTIHCLARSSSSFEGARTTEARLGRRRGCSCAMAAGSPTSSSSPFSLRVSSFIHEALSLFLSLANSRCFPRDCRTFRPRRARRTAIFVHPCPTSNALRIVSLGLHPLFSYISLRSSFSSQLPATYDPALSCLHVPSQHTIISSTLPFTFQTNVSFLRCRYFLLLLLLSSPLGKRTDTSCSFPPIMFQSSLHPVSLTRSTKALLSSAPFLSLSVLLIVSLPLPGFLFDLPHLFFPRCLVSFSLPSHPLSRSRVHAHYLGQFRTLR